MFSAYCGPAVLAVLTVGGRGHCQLAVYPRIGGAQALFSPPALATTAACVLGPHAHYALDAHSITLHGQGSSARHHGRLGGAADAPYYATTGHRASAPAARTALAV